MPEQQNSTTGNTPNGLENHEDSYRELKPDTALDDSMQSFIAEVKQPTMQALDTPQGNTQPPPQYRSLDSRQQSGADKQPEEQPAKDPNEPWVKKDDLDEDETGNNQEQAPPQPGPIYSEEYKDKTLRFYLEMEEKASAWIAAQIACTEDKTLFMYSDKSREMMVTVLEPYKEMIVSALPAWVPILIVYGGIKTEQMVRAVAMRKQSKKADSTAGTETNNYATNLKGTRTNFKLNKSLKYYHYDRNGLYVKANDLKERPLLEHIKEIFEANGAEMTCKALNVTEQYLKEQGLQ